MLRSYWFDVNLLCIIGHCFSLTVREGSQLVAKSWAGFAGTLPPNNQCARGREPRGLVLWATLSPGPVSRGG